MVTSIDLATEHLLISVAVVKHRFLSLFFFGDCIHVVGGASTPELLKQRDVHGCLLQLFIATEQDLVGGGRSQELVEALHCYRAGGGLPNGKLQRGWLVIASRCICSIEKINNLWFSC